MTRIIGGYAGSLRLGSPAKSTRPTSDRIRESIFSRLESRDAIVGKVVLDLYAGTGALALEAISRGAVAALLVERDGKAAAVCIQNALLVHKSLAKQDIDVETKVVNKAVASYLSTATHEFDLVFIDPPYEIANAEIEENLAALLPRLNAEATVIVERSSRGEKFAVPDGYELEESKSYGDTEVFWLNRA
ncbi:MAG: 16S rRNA (guanine(966)-N(2))-methyltransferase RsmD [Rhodoluna sp.]|nr:16S rRNA (guanine(966)-N(2))-methyltransferase RsmD [Rhodoluna sp.]MBP6186389.1 16S rRNA (guanine(966)-N(2))-methyltransferase RsmD [Rhodoluna sp.]